MNYCFSEDNLIKVCIDLLSQLISPAKKCTSEESVVNDFDEVVQSNLLKVRSSAEFSYLKIEDGTEFSWNISDARSRIRWHFICTCFQLLKTVRCILHSSQDEKLKLLGVSQKKVLENSFQFIVPLAILPYLLPGVGISLEAKSKHFKDLCAETLKDFAKYRRLCFVVDEILYLKENDTFNEIITSKYLEDILAALFQLSFTPIKKPSCENASFKGFDYVDDDFEITEMPTALWNRLQLNKIKYQNHLLAIQKQTYRPLVIRKYLILLDTKKTARWMKHNLTKMLTGIILEDGGVVALIRAIVEVDSDSPLQWSHCDVVARLISSTALLLDGDKLELFVSQMLKLLRTSRKQMYELVYIQVIAAAVKQMFSTNPTATMGIILNHILDPLKQIQQSNEDQISSSIEELYNLCILPTNSTSAMPIDIIFSVISILFKIHCKIKDSVSHLKSPVKELLGKYFSDADHENLIAAFNCIILCEPHVGIVPVPENLKFIFTGNGGVSVLEEESEDGRLENGVLLLDLIKNMQDNDRSINELFIYLLKKFITLDSEHHGEKRLVAMLLLTDLSQNETTLKQILKNSENIIQFIKDLLVKNSELETNCDIICVCLTFLTMVLYDLKKKKDVNWKPLDELRAPLETLKKSSSPEVKILADEVYNLIITRSLIGSTISSNDKKLIEEIPSACEEAFENACDDLLPVRAHGVMELISLLNKRDPETLAKIDKLLCLFQENMKDADCYLYLRAIEGLSTIALLKPDKILPFLCEEFTSCESPETQMKLGEILMRTVKLLQDFVPKYKLLLVNCFLNGAKNRDHLIRASSLSNLGEVCFMLKFNIEDVIHEILYCARNIALKDSNTEPRRAGVFLISSILRGLETCMFEVLEPVLLDLYKILQRIHQTDEDEVTRVHAKLALNVLNENTKQFFNPKLNFEKKIRVLDQF